MTISALNDTQTAALLPDYIARNQWRFKEAVNRFNRQAPPGPGGSFAGLFAYHWLRREVHPRYWSAILDASRNPAHAWLTTLLAGAASPEAFVAGLIEHGTGCAPDDPQGIDWRAWLAHHPVNPQAALLAQWHQLGLFGASYAAGVRQIQQEQKKTALEMGGTLDRQRLALVDALPAQPPHRLVKAGIIPRMACSQGCRHCMFVWRAPVEANGDPTRLLHWLNQHTQAILFTGGDLTRQLPLFEQAIRQMDQVRSFAILLNGAAATSLEAANGLLDSLRQARRQNGSSALPDVVLQISFDEFHQEIVANREGRLKERVPIACIANLVMSAVRGPDIRLVLLHKQNRLNFSTALFQRGVFARLAKELQRRGQGVRILHHAPSPRIKVDPVDSDRQGSVIRDALFVLTDYPERPIHFMSSTIDAYGRAALLDPSEFIHERRWLHEVLAQGAPPGEGFDTDLMFRTDGLVSCFAASHLWMGHWCEEGLERILARHGKDPLLRALERFDRRLLNYYQELADDLETILATSTGPHHLFHRLTERAAMRLHFTQRLLNEG